MANEYQRQTINCCLRTQAPIHLGCDDQYEPTGFVVDTRNNQLIVFDVLEFMAGLSEEDTDIFSRICQKGSIASLLEIYKFMRDRPVHGRQVDLCNGFINHYDDVLSLPLSDEKKITQELNSFAIERTAYLPVDGRPYIPGSAIKGAMRTAYLDWLAQQPNNRGIREKYADSLEQRLLPRDDKHFETDPFRLLKVSDFQPVGDIRTRVVYAVNRKKKLSKFEAHGPYQMLEVIEPGASFMGSITIEQPLRSDVISNPLSLEKLWESLRFFYDREIKREEKELEAIGVKGFELNCGQELCLLRLGRHSGAESLTIELHRSIYIMKPKNKGKAKGESSNKGATTLWLASEGKNPKGNDRLKPFGWACLEAAGPEEWARLKESESIWRWQRNLAAAEILDRRQEEEKRRAEEDRARREEQALREEEEKRRAEEEAQRLARLEKMSPAERDAERLKSDPDDNEVYTIYRRLDEYQDHDKKLLAQALKNYFIGKNKWKAKKKTKQWDKVQHIKGILGE